MNQDNAIMHTKKNTDINLGTDISTSPRSRKPIRVIANFEGKIDIKSTPEEAAISLFGEGGDPAAAKILIQKIINLASNNEDKINGTLALIAGLEPKNTAEAILAMHIVAVNNLALRLHDQAVNHHSSRNQTDLARTTLAASRTTGELLGRLSEGRRPSASTQKIIVERVDASQVAIGCNGSDKGEAKGI